MKQGGFENFRKEASPPSVIFSLHTSLKTVLDLTDSRVMKKIGTTPMELATSWRLDSNSSPTQTLGLATFHSHKFQAIRYYSRKYAQGICYVIFIERLDGKSFGAKKWLVECLTTI